MKKENKCCDCCNNPDKRVLNEFQRIVESYRKTLGTLVDNPTRADVRAAERKRRIISKFLQTINDNVVIAGFGITIEEVEL